MEWYMYIQNFHTCYARRAFNVWEIPWWYSPLVWHQKQNHLFNRCLLKDNTSAIQQCSLSFSNMLVMYYNKSKQRKTYENAFCDYSRHRPTCEFVYLAIFAVFSQWSPWTLQSLNWKNEATSRLIVFNLIHRLHMLLRSRRFYHGKA